MCVNYAWFAKNVFAAGRAISSKLWQTDIITKNKIISGYLIGNDQMIPKHNYSNNNYFYKKRKEQKGVNSNMYGLIGR